MDDLRRPFRTWPCFAALTTLIAILTAWSAGPAAVATRAAAPDAPAAAPIVGAALTILADGTAPFEDRPITLSGLGTLPGVRGKADPGDDVGPTDGVVRSWDAVVYRASFSVRENSVDDLVAEVTLAGPAVWEAGQLPALRLAGCPGGATLTDGGKKVRCVVGRVEAPPAVTVALDLTARVSGAALQGDALTADLTVRAPGAVPDPDAANCPDPQTDGCDDDAPVVMVSAAPAAELRKFLSGNTNAVHNGVLGRRLDWQLDVVLGADGDVRGSSLPVGAPFTLPDWWRVLGPTGRDLKLTVTLIGCLDLDGRNVWSCAQPGGPGTPLDVTLQRLDAETSLPNGVASAQPTTVAKVLVMLWVPETEVTGAGGDVTFHNCYATQIGNPQRSIWAPVDARGQANLGGIQEPPGNNCSYVVLPVPRAVPTRRPPRRPHPRAAAPTETHAALGHRARGPGPESEPRGAGHHGAGGHPHHCRHAAQCLGRVRDRGRGPPPAGGGAPPRTQAGPPPVRGRHHGQGALPARPAHEGLRGRHGCRGKTRRRRPQRGRGG